MERFKFISKNKIPNLPKTTGVYAFREANKVIYIGKAININNRIKQHRALLSRTKQLGYIETDSEIEALLLESRLIKKYQPKYNVMWKDDKNYFYVAVTKDPLPRIFIAHQISEKRSRYIGPFVEGNALKQTLRILRKIFPYYTLRPGSGQAQKKHPDKLCPWCHLNLCPGPNPDKKEYRKNIKNLISVLNGKRQSVLRNLKKEMALASKIENFEKAAKLRDQILALENIISHSKILSSQIVPRTSPWYRLRIEAYDVSNIQGKFSTGSMVVFTDGQPNKSQYRKFKIKMAGEPNDVAMIKEILSRRFNHPEWPYPNLILIDGGKGQLNAALLITKNYKLKTKVMALAKKHNELFIEGRKNPVLLKTLSREMFNLILQLRDEAHRFAIAYHKKLRAKDLIG